MPRAETPRKKVLLADDHLYIAEALRLHIEEKAADKFEVVAVVRDGAQALAETKRQRPDLVVMDVQMPKMDGIQALREMKKLDPPPTVMILSAYDDQAHVLDALRAGADDYLFKKDMTPERLAARMELAAAKGPSASGSGALAQAARILPREPELTPTEMNVLRLAAYHGASAKDISRELSEGQMSIRTIATHWQHIYAKLGVQSQAQAVSMAVKRGIISVEPTAKSLARKRVRS